MEIRLTSVRPDQRNQSSLRGRAHAVGDDGRAVCGWNKPGRKPLPGWPERRRCARCELCIKMFPVDVDVFVDDDLVRPSGRLYQQARLLLGIHDYRVAFTGQVRYEVPEDSDGCWVWLQSESSDYAYIGVKADGKLVRHRANRWFYDRYVGPLDPEHHVHHTCENKMCVNPRHLQLKNVIIHLRDHKVGHKMNLSEEERARRRRHGSLMAERNLVGRWGLMTEEQRNSQLRKMQEGRYAKK